jgi:hypothetical protein
MKEYEFFPAWFLEPLQTQLEFQTAVVHTQMFVSYLDEQRSSSIERNSVRQFLALAIWFR